MAILFPELLTGSTQALGLLNPVADLFLLGLYGGGVLVVREVTVRGSRGWAPVLLLGAAYGIAEEGLGTKTFFDAQAIHNTFPAPWGHWLGVNWNWAVELTLFHAAFSIGLPILLLGRLYPATRGRRLLSDRAGLAVFGAFLLTVAVMFELFDRSYSVAPVLVLGALLAIGGCVAAAAWIPSAWVRPANACPDRSPRAFAWAGAIFVWGFFGIEWIFGSVSKNVPLTAIGLIALTAISMRWVLQHIGETNHELQLTALAAGMLSFLIVLAGVEEIFGDWGVLFAILATLWVLRNAWRTGLSAVQAPARPVPPGALG